MKRLLIALVCIGAVVAVAACALQRPITMRLMGNVVTQNMQSTLLDELPDGLHVALCGAGSPLPDVNRSGPCTAVIAGEKIYVVDSGTNSSRIFTAMRLPQGAIEAILLTHFHSDHIDGLGELMLQRWINRTATSPVPVYGPDGVENVVDGFNQAYSSDFGFRVAHHGEATVPSSGAGGVARPFAEPANGTGAILIDDGDLKVTAFRVDHEPISPAVGYRFDYKGRSVVVSGDTAKSSNLEQFASGVDVLVHEALAAHLVDVMTEGARAADRPNLVKITVDILDYHTTPVEAAESAQTSGAKHLLFSHIVPPLPLAPLETIFVEGVEDVYDGDFTLGRDGTFISLEAGGTGIEVSELL